MGQLHQPENAKKGPKNWQLNVQNLPYQVCGYIGVVLQKHCMKGHFPAWMSLFSSMTASVEKFGFGINIGAFLKNQSEWQPCVSQDISRQPQTHSSDSLDYWKSHVLKHVIS